MTSLVHCAGGARGCVGYYGSSELWQLTWSGGWHKPEKTSSRMRIGGLEGLPACRGKGEW